MANRLVSLFAAARVRLLVPFALMALLALLLASPGSTARPVWEVRAACAITFALVAVGFAVPWRRLPGWTHPAVPLLRRWSRPR